MSALARLSGATRVFALVLILLLPFVKASAAQPADDETIAATQFVPDWMSSETAASLAVGIEVLIPEVVPAPFEGEPEVNVREGFYSLYWLLPGSPPTYLQIKGEAGGVIPDFSFYDRNVELVVNADVQGYPAYHDLTPIYDLIYWQVGDVVYSVESSNLTDTDSLTLANSLALLAVTGPSPEETPDDGSGEETSKPNLVVPETIGSGEVVGIEVSNANGATLTSSVGRWVDTGSDVFEDVYDGTFSWQAPNTAEDTYVRFLIVDAETQEWLAVGESTVIGTHIPTAASLGCPTPLDPEVLTPITLYGSGAIGLEATGGSFPATWPNNEFAPDADGSTTLAGTIPESGEVELQWQAPWVDEDTTFTIIASTVDGETLGTCDITLIAYVPPTEIPDDPGGGEGEGLPGGPIEEPSEIPIGEPIDEPVEEPTEEPADLPAEEPVEGPTVDVQTVDDSGDSGGPGEVIEAEEPTSTVRATSTVQSDTIRKTATPTATGTATPTPEPSATPTPTPTEEPRTGPQGMVAQVVGPKGGRLYHPAGATLVIPKGALSDESTVTIMSVDDRTLPVSDRIEFIPETGFDISVADAAGQPIERLSKAATLRVDLEPELWRREMVVYWINGSDIEVLSDTQLDDASISVPLKHFSRFAAGVPITGNENTNRLTYVIAVVAALATIAACIAVISATRRRRTLTVGPRHVPARHRRS